MCSAHRRQPCLRPRAAGAGGRLRHPRHRLRHTPLTVAPAFRLHHGARTAGRGHAASAALHRRLINETPTNAGPHKYFLKLSWVAPIRITNGYLCGATTMIHGIIRLDDEVRALLRTASEPVRVGDPMPWSVFDSVGRQMVRKGAMVQSRELLNRLVERGAFRSSGEVRPASQEADKQNSPFFVIGELMARLHTLLYSIATRRGDNALSVLGEVCTAMQVMCAQDADATLAALHLSHEGKYIVRHPIHSGLLVELVAYRLGYTPDERHKMIAAMLMVFVGLLVLLVRLLLVGGYSPVLWLVFFWFPVLGVVLLRAAGVTDELWLSMVAQHHERMDGSGYPLGLKDEGICRGARIIALADVYHAKISERAGRAPGAPARARRRGGGARGGDGDRGRAKAFIKELGVYPPGAFVRLANGEHAVVTHRGQEGLLPRGPGCFCPPGLHFPRPAPRPRGRGHREFNIKDTAPRDAAVLVTDLLPLWGY